jgi:very-short-patch-repair endonuclease
MHDCCEEIESPIEQKLLDAMVSIFIANGYATTVEVNDRWYEYKAKQHIMDALINCQQILDKREMNVAVDFVANFWFEDGDFSSGNVIVECDGHDYHERTKDQAKKDRSIDRWVQHPKSTYVAILRFTGSEIHRAPALCAKEIMDDLRARIDRAASLKSLVGRCLHNGSW